MLQRRLWLQGDNARVVNQIVTTGCPLPHAIDFREEAFARALETTLKARPAERASLFETLAKQVTLETTGVDPDKEPWTCTPYDGTDGSRIFRSGVGLSLVIDPEGRMWRARSLEDFETTYRFTDNSCVIDTLTPRYETMREYLPR